MTEVLDVNPELVGIKTVTVKKNNYNLFLKLVFLIGRIGLGLFGLFSLLLSGVLMLTIIGIIPGLMIMPAALFFIGISFLNLQEVKCPHCNKKSAVQKNSEDFECKRCKNSTIIEWE